MHHVRVRAKLPAAGLCVVLASLLAGCASYKVRPLRKLDRSTAKYIAEKNGVSIYAAPIEKKELKEYFNGESIPKKYALIPLLLTVQNNSAQKLMMHAHELDMRVISADQLIDFLGLRNAPSIIYAAKVPLIITGTIVGMFVMAGVTCGVEIVFLVPPLVYGPLPFLLITSGAISYLGKRQFYASCCTDMHNKIFSEIRLDCGESVTKLMFVAADQLKPTLLFMVHSGADKELSEKTELAAVSVERVVK